MIVHIPPPKSRIVARNFQAEYRPRFSPPLEPGVDPEFHVGDPVVFISPDAPRIIGGFFVVLETRIHNGYRQIRINPELERISISEDPWRYAFAFRLADE